MFNLKVKTNNEPQIQHRKAVSPGQHKNKSKKVKQLQTKSTKVLIKDATIIPIKRKHHLPSKSSIQTLQNKLYNSPNFQLYKPSDPRKVNQCTFTHLLQQQPKNHGISSNSMRVGMTQNGDFSYSCNYDTIRDNNNRKTPITNLTLTPAAASVSHEEQALREMEFSNMLNHRLTAIHDQVSKSTQKSQTKEGKKSPYRVVNTNRLNNTPKIKETGARQQKEDNNKKEKHKQERIQNKTFAAMLSNSSGTVVQQVSIAKQQIINLQCSEKIYKFLSQNTHQKQLIIKSPRNKSNLLSTGIINLSQPFDLVTSNRPQLSKETIQSNLHIDKAISKDNIKPFSSDGSVYCTEHFPSRISKIKKQIKEMNDFLIARTQNYNFRPFSNYIESKYNPQLGSKCDINLEITDLLKIKEQFQAKIAEIMDKLKVMRSKVSEQIQYQIQNKKMSEMTLIDWSQLGNQLEAKDKIDAILSKNQLLNHRIEHLQAVFNINVYKDEIILLPQQKQAHLIMELKLIESQLAYSANSIDNIQLNISHGSPKAVKQKMRQFYSRLKELQDIVFTLL